MLLGVALDGLHAALGEGFELLGRGHGLVDGGVLHAPIHGGGVAVGPWGELDGEFGELT